MAAPILVYVHGSGPQGYAASETLKFWYDRALFGADGPSVAPIWWPVFWGEQDAAAEADLEAVIQRLARDPLPPTEAATELLAAIRRARPPRERTGAMAELSPTEIDAQAIAHLADLFESSDTGVAEMPEPIFRLLAGWAGKDVVPYLYDGWAHAMREPVKAELRRLGADRPIIVLAHSLGSVLAYDVVTDAHFKGYDVRLFITAGSPLGIVNVRDKVRDRAGPGDFPSRTKAWRNFYDPRDLVGKFGETLKHKYLPLPPLTEKLDVSNERDGHHDLVGYLVDPDLRFAAKAALGLPV
jgi:hypothetical protein